MDNPIDVYSNIQMLVKNEIDNAIKEYASNSKYGVFPVVAHQHTGVDSSKISYNDLLNKPTISTYTPKFYSGSGARTTGDGTGNQSITGIGFKPLFIKITANASGGNSSISFGSSDGIIYSVLEHYYNATPVWTYSVTNANVIYTRNTGGNFAKATVNSFDTDGFTLNWNTMGVNCAFVYECYG